MPVLSDLLYFIVVFNFLLAQTVYFQCNIATNGSTTYVSFIYDDGGMLWEQNWIRTRVGYSLTREGRRERFEQILNRYGYPSAYKFDDIVGNTNFKGRWSWKLSEKVINNGAECREWYEKQPSKDYIEIIRNHGPSDCPCLYWQVIFDRRFRFSSYDSSMICYKQRATLFFLFTSLSFHTSCCYDRRNLFLVRDLDPSIGVATQKHLSLSYSWLLIRFFGYYRFISRRQAVIDDAKAFYYCCYSSSLCHLYIEKRPVPTCSRYIPPIMGMLTSFYPVFHFLLTSHYALSVSSIFLCIWYKCSCHAVAHCKYKFLQLLVIS